MSVAIDAVSPRTALKVPKDSIERVVGLVLLLAIWQVMTSVIFTGRHVVPSPFQVVQEMVLDHFYLPSLLATLSEAGRGWLIGNGAAIVLAGVSLIFPMISRSLLQFGAITYCVPTVAIGPLVFIFISPDAAKVAIAALSVFFVSLVAWITGLRAADQSLLDLVHCYGGSRFTELFRVRLRSALPSAGGGLALSAPAAILGAIIGEYLGGVNGLGVLMVSSEENFQVTRTWAIGIEATIVSGVVYALIHTAMRRLAGAPGVGTAMAPPSRRPYRNRWAAGAGHFGGPAVATVLLVVVWELIIKVLDLSNYLAKSPAAVWTFLTVGPSGASNRATIFSALGITLRDAMLGWLLGTAAALIGSALLIQMRRARSVVLPMVMILRSVPLIAMTPLIALVFGQGVLGVMIVAAIVSFVPSLVLVTSGLESAPAQAIELARAYHLSNFGTLVRVRSRYALPSLFSAGKVAMPGAILGAVLAEWLLTGNGIGHLMASSLIESDFSTLWASVAMVSVVSLVLFEVVGSLEGVFLRQVVE